MIADCIRVLNNAPEKLNIERIIDILGEEKELDFIMDILVKKFEYLYKKNLENQNSLVMLGDIGDVSEEYKNITITILQIISQVFHEIIYFGDKDNLYIPNITDLVKKIFTPNGKFKVQELELIKYSLINIICSSDVRFIHELLFDHLNKFKLMDIKSIKSQYVEEYLRQHAEDSEDSNKYLETLYKHYITCGEYENALRIIKSIYNLLIFLYRIDEL